MLESLEETLIQLIGTKFVDRIHQFLLGPDQEAPRIQPHTTLPRPSHRPHGPSVNGITESPSGATGRPWPPAEITTYCLPSGPRKVIGTERALVGRSPFQSSLPVVTSKARRAESSVPAMNPRPPAVTIGPPSAMEPYWAGGAGAGPICGN